MDPRLLDYYNQELIYMREMAGEFAQSHPKIARRLGMQAGVLSIYFLSVVLTGWLFRYKPLAAGVLPGVSVLLVALHALIYND